MTQDLQERYAYTRFTSSACFLARFLARPLLTPAHTRKHAQRIHKTTPSRFDTTLVTEILLRPSLVVVLWKRRPGATRISCLFDRRRRKVTSLEGSSSRTAERALLHKMQISPAYCTASWWSSELVWVRGREQAHVRQSFAQPTKTQRETRRHWRSRLAASTARGLTAARKPQTAESRSHTREHAHTPSDRNAISIHNEVAHEPRVCPQLFHGLLNLRLHTEKRGVHDKTGTGASDRRARASDRPTVCGATHSIAGVIGAQGDGAGQPRFRCAALFAGALSVRCPSSEGRPSGRGRKRAEWRQQPWQAAARLQWMRTACPAISPPRTPRVPPAPPPSRPGFRPTGQRHGGGCTFVRG